MLYSDSMLHTGDENLSLDNNVQILQNLTTQLKQTFPTMDVYATYGNHDYYPNGQYPPHNNEIYNRTLDHWRAWINDSTQESTFLKGQSRFRSDDIAINHFHSCCDLPCFE
jgi:sphingomyelin phosphodiesterase acid-like 3